jgi:hypothetical protein
VYWAQRIGKEKEEREREGHQQQQQKVVGFTFFFPNLGLLLFSCFAAGLGEKLKCMRVENW